MYGQLTTGKAAKVKSKISDEETAYECELILDTKKNMPEIIRGDFVIWDRSHGTRFEVNVKGKYIGGKQSVFEYLKGVAIVNPHAKITFVPPEGNTVVFERASEVVPTPVKEVKPHPDGIELGEMLSMAKYTESHEDDQLPQHRVLQDILQGREGDMRARGRPAGHEARQLSLEQAAALLDAIKKVKIMAPETDCLSPIGETLIRKGLKNVLGEPQGRVLRAADHEGAEGLRRQPVHNRGRDSLRRGAEQGGPRPDPALREPRSR